jgi:hypothetical protein
VTAWRVILRNPKTFEELALEGWTDIQVTENFDGVSATINVPGERTELRFITELITNVLLYSNKVLTYQLRIMDAEDTFSENGHTVSLTCNSYESILSRRVLFHDYQTGAPPAGVAMDQHEIAWQLVQYTQNFEDIGIRKATNWAASTRQQNRIIQRGVTIQEAINQVAEMENGFDWWIDANLRMHAQTTRRLFDTGLDLIWGAKARTVTRSSAADTYDSVVMVIGATNETQLESGAVFPAPKPAIRAATVRPYGRWERSYVYGDLFVQAHVDSKAKFHLDDAAMKKATYRVGLEVGVWDQTIRPGGLFSLRVRSLPRLDFRVRCRIEELSVQIGPSGEEVVELGARAEDVESEITPTPIARVDDEIPSSQASPPEEVVVDVTGTSGRSLTIARTSEMNDLAAMWRGFDKRLSRTEQR